MGKHTLCLGTPTSWRCAPVVRWGRMVNGNASQFETHFWWSLLFVKDLTRYVVFYNMSYNVSLFVLPPSNRLTSLFTMNQATKRYFDFLSLKNVVHSIMEIGMRYICRPRTDMPPYWGKLSLSPCGQRESSSVFTSLPVVRQWPVSWTPYCRFSVGTGFNQASRFSLQVLVLGEEEFPNATWVVSTWWCKLVILVWPNKYTEHLFRPLLMRVGLPVDFTGLRKVHHIFPCVPFFVQFWHSWPI